MYSPGGTYTVPPPRAWQASMAACTGPVAFWARTPVAPWSRTLQASARGAPVGGAGAAAPATLTTTQTRRAVTAVLMTREPPLTRCGDPPAVDLLLGLIAHLASVPAPHSPLQDLAGVASERATSTRTLSPFSTAGGRAGLSGAPPASSRRKTAQRRFSPPEGREADHSSRGRIRGTWLPRCHSSRRETPGTRGTGVGRPFRPPDRACRVDPRQPRPSRRRRSRSCWRASTRTNVGRSRPRSARPSEAARPRGPGRSPSSASAATGR